MKRWILGLIPVFLVLLIAIGFQNCGGFSAVVNSPTPQIQQSVESVPPSLNGDYGMTDVRCGSSDITTGLSGLGVSGLVFIFSGNSGDIAMSVGTCIINIPTEISYTSSTTFTAQANSVNCSSSCPSVICQPQTTLPTPFIQAFTLAETGSSSIALSTALGSSDIATSLLKVVEAGCGVGATLTMQLVTPPPGIVQPTPTPTISSSPNPSTCAGTYSGMVRWGPNDLSAQISVASTGGSGISGSVAFNGASYPFTGTCVPNGAITMVTSLGTFNGNTSGIFPNLDASGTGTFEGVPFTWSATETH